MGADGCGQDTVLLIVELKTDFLPEREFDSVRVRLPGRGETVTFEVRAGDDFLVGQRIADLTLEPAAQREVIVDLVGPGGAVVTSRSVLTPNTLDRAIVVVIARDCQDVECPGSGDAPDATECLGGRCVESSCLDVEASCPPPECAVAADCPTPVCGEAICDTEAGVCLARPDDSVCASAEYCDPDVGCRPDPRIDGGVVDAGLDAGLDAGDCLSGVAPILSHSFQMAMQMGGFVSLMPDLAPRPPDLLLTASRGDSITVTGGVGTFAGTETLDATGPGSEALVSQLMAGGGITFEVWMVPMTLATGLGSPAALTGAFYLSQLDPNQTQFRTGGAMVFENGVLAEGTLVHLVATHDIVGLGRAELFIDGTPRRSGSPAPVSGWSTTGNVYKLGGGLMNFSGQIHRVALYDRVLTPAEIACLFAEGPTYLP